MTLQDLDAAGRDVRAWCFACARGDRVDTIVWQRFAARGWPMAIGVAATRFTCGGCGSSTQVGLFPIGRPPARANEGALLVEAFFHGMRSMRKRAKNDASAEVAAGRLVRQLPARAVTIHDPFTIVEVSGSYAVAWRAIWQRELSDNWVQLKGARWIADGPFNKLADAKAAHLRLLARLAEGPKAVD